MIVRGFTDNIRCQTGKDSLGEFVIKRRPGGVHIKRRHFIPRRTETQEFATVKFKAAVDIYKEVSNAFKEDLKVYASLYNAQHRAGGQIHVSGYNIFIKALCKHYTTFDDITDIRNTYGARLSLWISAGVIPAVRTEYRFNAAL